MTACLSDSEIRRHLAKELGDEQADRVQDHLTHCQRCSNRQDDLVTEHESWVSRVQHAGAPRLFGELSNGNGKYHLPKSVIKGYEIKEELNRGGQGIVYRAIQNSTHRDVAIKVLREGPFASKEDRRRFEREVDVVAGFRHPSIVTVFDSGVTVDGRQYCVMDYVAGLPLNQFILERDPSLREILDLFVKICDAVNYAHQRGVIHRDLKPANILIRVDSGSGSLNADGNVTTPQILDFGLAKRISSEQQTLLTTQGIVAGTIPYLAPEQARGRDQDVDIRSDVYSLGVILFEILTGGFPYPTRGDITDVLRHIAETPAERPSKVLKRLGERQDTDLDISINNGVSDQSENLVEREIRSLLSRSAEFESKSRRDEIETIVLKALSKEPERRYQTAAEFGRDVERFLNSEPIEAKRDSRWYILKKSARRHRTAVAVFLMFVLVITGSLATMSYLYFAKSRLAADLIVKRQEAEAAEKQAKRRFDDIRELTRTFLFEFYNDINNLSGAAEAKHKLISTTTDYLNRLAADLGPNDTKLHLELATAYAKLGDIFGDQKKANLEDVEKALASYQKSLVLFDAVVVLDRGGLFEIRRNKARIQNRMGQMLIHAGRQNEANAQFDASLEMIRQLLDEYPEHSEIRLEYADALWLLAQRQARDGDLNLAIQTHKEALAITESLDPDPKNQSAACHDIASSCGLIGQILIRQEKLDEALSFHRRSLEMLDRISEADPFNVVYRRDLSIAHERVGYVLQLKGEVGEALSHMEKSLVISQKIAKENPTDRSARAACRSAHCRIGEVKLSEGNFEEALAHFSRFKDLTEQEARELPDESKVQRDVGIAFYKMSEFHKAVGYSLPEKSSGRLAAWRNELASLEQAYDHFVDLKQRGLLWESDAGVPDMLKSEIAVCKNRVDSVETNAAPQLTDIPVQAHESES